MRTAAETADAVRRGEVTAAEVLEECLAAIDRDGRLNAFVHLAPDLARGQAAAVDAAVARGEDPGPLAGVPLGVKDLEDCAGMPTGRGSRLYAGGPAAAADSVHVARLRAAGAVPVGKTATPEFGALPITSSPATGTTRNPWHLDRTPGGSSGGSGAAVAGGLVPLATASDAGGSTRIPAAFCGLVGLKPSFGRIPNPRVDPSLTAAPGALARTVTDAARHLDAAAGPDDRDRTSLPPPGVTYARAVEELDLAGLRAAWSPDLGFAVVDPEVERMAWAAALSLVADAGLELVERPVAAGDVLALWEACTAGDYWYDLAPGMWPERVGELTGRVRSCLLRTETVTGAEAAALWARRAALDEALAGFMGEVDVLLCPTTAVVAFAAEGPLPFEIGGRDASASGPTPLTELANLTGNPAVSVPAGVGAAGLPVGLQIIGRRHRDDVVLRLARVHEECRPWPLVAPGFGLG